LANDFERMYEIISWRMGGLDSTSFSIELFQGINVKLPVHLFTRMVREWFTKENINDCLCPPLATAVMILGKSHTTQYQQWKSVIQHLIRLGTNLQRGFRDGATILDNLMDGCGSPFESRPLGLAWLDILIELRIDVVEYLRTEYSHHFDPSKSLPMLRKNYRTDFRPRYLIISEETPSASWDWFINAEGKAFDVLEEFKNFGPGRHDVLRALQNPGAAYNWPFFYPVRQWCVQQLREYPSCHKDTIAIAQLAEDRFERRWHKKAMKLARAQGIIHRGPKMPGAWID
jgi:hypothetical protein